MEIKLKKVDPGILPWAKAERPHDEFAKKAIDKFAKSDMDTAVLELPEFSVSFQTVTSLLRQYAVAKKVKVSVLDLAGRRTNEQLRDAFGDSGKIVVLSRKK